MDEFLLANEQTIRLSIFLGVFTTMAVWEALAPRRAQPAAGHDAMTIGIEQFRGPRELWLDRLLLQPFKEEAGAYPINRRDS
ncbi:MAG: hypothetical protein KAT39_13765 [Alphaproteobacteria bacterium]|nr:hypothetical protein [Alphaproteobacteria bacterium]